jgi:hypothetical protein
VAERQILLRAGERQRCPAVRPDDDHPLLDRRAERAVPCVDDLVPEGQAALVSRDHAAPDREEIADTQLPQIPDAALGDDGGATGAERLGAEPERVEESKRRVLEAGEVVRHGEMIDIVHFPTVHGSAIGLGPGHGGQHPTNGQRRKGLGSGGSPQYTRAPTTTAHAGANNPTGGRQRWTR